MNRFKLLTLILIAVWPTMLSSAARADVSAAELQDAYKWFDTLGYPDIGKLPFVQVAGGSHPDWFGGAVSNHTVGFLVADNGETFTVLASDLRTVTFTRTDASASGPKRVGYDKADLFQWARRWISSSDRSDPTNSDEYLDIYAIGGHGGINTSVQVFVLARAIATHGNPQLASELYNAAERGQYKYSLQSRMRSDIPAAIAHRAYGEFGDLGVSREALLAEYREISSTVSGE